MPIGHCVLCCRFVRHKNKAAAAERAKDHSTMMKGAANTMLQGTSTGTPEAWIKAAMETYHSRQLHSSSSGGSGRTPAATVSALLATPNSDMANNTSTGKPVFQSHHRMYDYGKSDCSTQGTV
jgi:hypothetical protein